MGQLQKQIEELKQDIQDLQDQIDNFELDPSDFEDEYDNMLDSTYPELFNMTPSYILSELDPIAYSCGLNDYLDSIDVSDSPEYQELEEELSDLESELEDLEMELEDEE